MHVAYTKPVLGLSAIRSPVFRSLFDEYEQGLLRAGYSHIVVRFHLHAIAHFGVWIEFEDHGLRTIGDETLCAFERHRAICACPGTSRNRARKVLSCVRGYLQYLRERGVVESVEVRSPCIPLVQEFVQWMEAHRGVIETTLGSYAFYVGELVHSLGDDPLEYTARGLRVFVEKRFQHYRRNSIRIVFAAVRMFLRYLAVEGKCRTGLEHALTPPANWSQQSLPRGLSAEEVERVLAGCPSSPRGLRDRAVLLLLIRLGLRAGDVSRLPENACGRHRPQLRRRDQPRPRLHDLRFYFANQALTNSPDDHQGISRQMVALTTYLGHSDVRNSYWYLEATPKLLSRIAQRCEDFVNGGSQ